MSVHRYVCYLALVLSVIVCIVEANHVPSPHRFECPPKNSKGGIKECMTCAAKFKFMLDQICKSMKIIIYSYKSYFL